MSHADDTIRVMDIIEGTSVDGPGLRTSVYLAGCAHRCPGCHNPQTWDFAAGRDMTVAEILEVVRRADFDLTLTGGDPMYQARALLPLVRAVKEAGYDIWCYTGFTLEELDGVDGAPALLPYIDTLVDGPFVEALKNTDLIFRGSSNQRIIDLHENRAML